VGEAVQRRRLVQTVWFLAVLLAPGSAIMSKADETRATGAPTAPVTAPAAAYSGEKRVALVIGNADYEHYPKLKNPANDALDVAQRLRELGFEVVERSDLTSRQIGSTLREFRVKLEGATVALVYVAGHGMQIKGENYFPGVDADIAGEEDIPNQSLALRQLLDLLGDARTQLNLLFLDACRDNPFAAGTRSGSRGLARVEAPSGTLISYATRPGSVARDGDGRNGLYTAQLLQQMAVAADLPIETVLKRVVSGVKQGSEGLQEPWWEGSIEGNFCFAACREADSAGVAVPVPEAPPADAGVKPSRTTGILSPVAHPTARPSPAPVPPADPGTAVEVSIPNIESLWFTHAFSRNQNGRLAELVGKHVKSRHIRTTAGNGGMFSAAESPAGELYFCDATEARIFKIEADHEVVVYQHHAPIKHLEFGANGRLYFSSVMGSRDPGTIYELEGATATAYYALQPGALPATWAGGFAFDTHGMLWLSSGPQRPASLYRVHFQTLEKVFTTGDTGIMGFGFLRDGSIVYADNARSVMHLTLPSLQATRLFESPFEGWLTDVKPVRDDKK